MTLLQIFIGILIFLFGLGFIVLISFLLGLLIEHIFKLDLDFDTRFGLGFLILIFLPLMYMVGYVIAIAIFS
jgi:Trk-type K+ transport system membrane component